MLEMTAFVVTILAVWGVLLNNRRSSACFKLWIASNILSATIHCFTGPVMLIIRDLIFLILAVEGMMLWRRPAERRPEFRRCLNFVTKFWREGIFK